MTYAPIQECERKIGGLRRRIIGEKFFKKNIHRMNRFSFRLFINMKFKYIISERFFFGWVVVNENESRSDEADQEERYSYMLYEGVFF